MPAKPCAPLDDDRANPRCASYYAGSPHRCRPHRNGQHHHLCTAQLVRSDEVNPDPVSAPVARLGAMTSTSTNTAHAIIQTDPKDPSSLEWQAIDKPQPAEGEALVRIHYAGLNRADTLQAQGHYPPPKGVTETIGLEAAGVVEKPNGTTKPDGTPSHEALQVALPLRCTACAPAAPAARRRSGPPRSGPCLAGWAPAVWGACAARPKAAVSPAPRASGRGTSPCSAAGFALSAPPS